MSSVGAYLRDLRERQGVSLDELSRATRVLRHYLEALETDDLASLPAPVFAKGFIRACCQVLGVPPDEAIELYERRAGQIPDSARAPAPPLPASDPRVPAAVRERREGRGRGAVLVSFVLLVVLGAALFAVTLALQSGRETDGGRPVRDATPQPPVSAAARPAPVPAESPVAPEAPAPPKPPPSAQQPSAPVPPANRPSVTATVPAPSAAAAAGIASPYRLVARTRETTWMSVRTEDGRTIEETIPAGQVREWVSNRPFVLSIGNAGGVSLELNGQPYPQLGPSGAVIRRLILPAETP